MTKIVNMQGKGMFSKNVTGAVIGAAKKVRKLLKRKVRLLMSRKKKKTKTKNPGGQSTHHVAVPKSTSRRMRKQRR